MKITKATLKDVNQIIKLSQLSNEFSVSEKTASFWPKSILIDCIQDDHHSVILTAKMKEKIIGFIRPLRKLVSLRNFLVLSKVP
jgi:hypothetical protein